MGLRIDLGLQFSKNPVGCRASNEEKSLTKQNKTLGPIAAVARGAVYNGASIMYQADGRQGHRV